MQDFFLTLLKKTGEYTFVFVIFLLAAQYWHVIQLQNIPIPYVVDLLYIYLLINATGLAYIIYQKKKSYASVVKYCHYCNAPLGDYIQYKCTKCGRDN